MIPTELFAGAKAQFYPDPNTALKGRSSTEARNTSIGSFTEARSASIGSFTEARYTSFGFALTVRFLLVCTSSKCHYLLSNPSGLHLGYNGVRRWSRPECSAPDLSECPAISSFRLLAACVLRLRPQDSV